MKSISLDNKGVCINGEYKILLASSLFYFRIPREKWDERMKMLKKVGYNTIDIYFPWNFHEVEQEYWDFSGERDVEYFLKLAVDNELYVIARPGPYICSEWDGGALPTWLSINDIPIRQDDEKFLKEVDKWYSRILPIIRKYQIINDGTIICMQIENELDFYSCVSPMTYMEKLKRMAKGYGIEIPMFYCCGQNDILRGGGLIPDLYFTFNVYDDFMNENLEERALHLYHSAQGRNASFLITETNRSHSFMKRMLCCGAKLISPYNQTASATMDYYNAISNWGEKSSPLALLSSDYDFDSMIGSAGEVTEEFYEARLLSSFMYSFETQLGKAKATDICPAEIKSTHKINSVIPYLAIEKGGFIAISNLSYHENYIDIKIEQSSIRCIISSKNTAIIPVNIELGNNLLLVCSNYEIASANKNKTNLSFYGKGDFEAILQKGKEKIVIHKKMESEYEELEMEGLCFSVGKKEHIAMSTLNGIIDVKGDINHQYESTDVLEVQCNDYQSQFTHTRDENVACMEQLKQYRGIGAYEVNINDDSEIILHDVADFLTIYKEDECCEIKHSDGASIRRRLGKGKYRFETEIWGHANFNSNCQFALNMKSTKGISKITEIQKCINLKDNWYFDLDNQTIEPKYMFRHSEFNTIMSIDSYIHASSPLQAVYSRWIEIEEWKRAILYFEKVECIVYLYINGSYIAQINKKETYIDISEYVVAGSKIELTLRVLRKFYIDEVGAVELIYGTPILKCQYSVINIFENKNKEIKTNSLLPISIDGYGKREIVPYIDDVGESDIKLVIQGKNILLTVLCNNHIVGRVLLAEEGFPLVKGGKKDIVFICKEWLQKDKAVKLIAQGLSSSESELTSIQIKRYSNLIE